MRKILIFDMDGVLFNSISFAQESFLREHLGLTIEAYKELLCGNFHEEIQKLPKSERTEEEREMHRIWYAEQKAKSPLYEGVDKLLKKLHTEEYILVLNSSAYERNCKPLLEKAHIMHWFDFVATAEISKSKVEKFGMIEEKYDATKEQMLFITDTVGDIKEAHQANIPTVAVTWGVHDKTYFSRNVYHNLIKIVESISELEEFIDTYHW